MFVYFKLAYVSFTYRYYNYLVYTNAECFMIVGLPVWISFS